MMVAPRAPGGRRTQTSNGGNRRGAASTPATETFRALYWTDPRHHALGPLCSTTRNLCTVKSSTSSSLKRAFLITTLPTASLPIASKPMAAAPNAAAPTASANRLAVEMAPDCTLTSRDISNPLLKHVLFASPFGNKGADIFCLYPVHAKTRKSFGEMTRKLSVTASQ